MSNELLSIKNENKTLSNDNNLLQSKINSVDDLCITHILNLKEIMNQFESISMHDPDNIRNQIQNTNSESFKLGNHLYQLREYICLVDN